MFIAFSNNLLFKNYNIIITNAESRKFETTQPSTDTMFF